MTKNLHQAFLDPRHLKRTCVLAFESQQILSWQTMAAKQWPPREVSSLQAGFKDLVDRVAARGKRSESESDEDLILLTRFLVVRASGFVEQATYSVVRGYIEAKSGGMVRSFAHSWIERTRNPSPANLEALLGRLDMNLSERFSGFMDESSGATRRRDYLDLLVNKRNQIAHGFNEGAGLQSALNLSVIANEVADWFIRELNPEPRSWIRAGGGP